MKKLLIVWLVVLSTINLLAQKRILFVTSNQHFYGNTNINTSNHFEEITIPYDIFTKAGFVVDFISPKGGAIPLGYINTSDSIQKKHLYDNVYMNQLKYTKKPSEINPDNYAAIFYGGGGAAMYGVPEDITIQKLAKNIYSKKGIIATICHGTAGIAYLKDDNGKSLYAGKKITGYPDYFENKEMDYYKAFPFSMDKAIKNNNGNFVYSKNRGDGFYVVDGRFVTGQDPSSSAKVAHEIVSMLRKNL